MATTLRIDIADQPNHRRKGQRREVGRTWTDEVLCHMLLTAAQTSEVERRELALRAAGMVLRHPCRASLRSGRGCRHPGHAADADRLREWLDGLGLLPDPAPAAVAAPEPVVRVPRRGLDMSWTERAACRGEDTNLFFGVEGEQPHERDIRERKATAVCAVCPVDGDCLAFAVGHGIRDGVWGGLGEDDRAGYRRRQGRPRVQPSPSSPPPVPVGPGEQQCWRCAVVKPLSAFERRRRNKNGHYRTCKSCRKEGRRGA